MKEKFSRYVNGILENQEHSLTTEYMTGSFILQLLNLEFV